VLKIYARMMLHRPYLCTRFQIALLASQKSLTRLAFGLRTRRRGPSHAPVTIAPREACAVTEVGAWRVRKVFDFTKAAPPELVYEARPIDERPSPRDRGFPAGSAVRPHRCL